MSFLNNLFGLFGKKQSSSPQKKDLPVTGGHVEKDEPLYCPKCRDRKRDTIPPICCIRLQQMWCNCLHR